MHRRHFCKLIAATAAGFDAIPLPTPAVAEQPSAFNTFTEDYAAFCATPSSQRIYYVLENGRISPQHLDDSTWSVAPNSESGPHMPPALPLPGGSWNGVPLISPIHNLHGANLSGIGTYQPTWDSLLQYDAPEWYRDAKFGIWAHWSPQCVPEAGDWYARNMYIQGSEQYNYHLAHYGHPSKFGFKDLIPQWSLLNWQPDALMQRYKNAGAKFFFALANHHDNFDAFNSRHNPWNSVALGPHRDVVGEWVAAARNHNLRFGVTIHQPRNWWWFQTAHSADSTGPLAGVPYDGHLTLADGTGQWWQGLDPQFLYAPKHPPMALPDISYVMNFYRRTRDLIDQYSPDVLYFDNNQFPLGWAGLNLAAYYYNRSLQMNSGHIQGVITTKVVPDSLAKCVVAGFERAITNEIKPYPWYSETCIGGWHYQRSLFKQPGEFGGYMHPRDVIHWLVDTVSKNGTFMLNIPGRPDGTIDSKEIAVIDQITVWMQTNSEAIHATRPWKIFGEGPSTQPQSSTKKFNPPPSSGIPTLSAADIRFTRNKSNTILYAIVMGLPASSITIRSLGTAAPTSPGKVTRVSLLGYEGSNSLENIQWSQSPAALTITLPANYHPTTNFATAFRLHLT